MRIEYDSRIYSHLNDFPVARKCLEERIDSLSVLGEIICRHHFHHSVGIALLHKHFELNPDERLVEEFVKNSFHTRPYVEDSLTDIVPYLWKAEHNEATGKWTYFPLEFVHATNGLTRLKDVAKAVASNHAFLKEMAEKLVELGLTSIFGITALHRGLIKLDEGEIIVETTDDAARTLTCAATTINTIDPGTLTQTVWEFTVNGDQKSVNACIAHDKCSHCVNHCLHCFNHPK